MRRQWIVPIFAAVVICAIKLRTGAFAASAADRRGGVGEDAPPKASQNASSMTVDASHRPYVSSHHDITDFVNILVLWTVAFLSEVCAKATKWSPRLFYLVYGCFLGNVGIIRHTHVIHFVAELGITIIFLALGFEENVPHFLEGIKKAWGIASIGAIVPFICGVGCVALLWPDESMESWLMAGLAVTATEVSLTLISLKSAKLSMSKAALGIMTSAVLDDIMCICLVPIMVPLCTGAAPVTVAGVVTVMVKCLIFFAIIIFCHNVVFPHDITWGPLKCVPGVRWLGVNHLVRFNSGAQASLVTLAFGLGFGLLATFFDSHPTIGAYMVGLILDERCYEIPHRKDVSLDEKKDKNKVPQDVKQNPYNAHAHVEEVLQNAAFVWLGPMFFIYMGSKIKIRGDVLGHVLGQSVIIYLVVSLSQVVSASLAARFAPGGFNWTESWMVGFGMIGRGEVFFVVLDICYNQHAIFSEQQFFALTCAAVMCNVTMPFLVNMYRPYYFGDKKCFGQGDAERTADDMSQLEKEFQGIVKVMRRKVLKQEKQKERRAYKPVFLADDDPFILALLQLQAEHRDEERQRALLRMEENLRAEGGASQLQMLQAQTSAEHGPSTLTSEPTVAPSVPEYCRQVEASSEAQSAQAGASSEGEHLVKKPQKGNLAEGPAFEVWIEEAPAVWIKEAPAQVALKTLENDTEPRSYQGHHKTRHLL